MLTLRERAADVACHDATLGKLPVAKQGELDFEAPVLPYVGAADRPGTVNSMVCVSTR